MENLTTETFKEKVFDHTQNSEWSYKGDKPAIIDFWAEWCAPCKAVSPVLEELETEHNGDFILFKINTEEQPELAGVFGIRSIPSLLFVPVKGQPQMVIGAIPKDTLNQAITEVLFSPTIADEAKPEDAPKEEKTEDKPE